VRDYESQVFSVVGQELRFPVSDHSWIWGKDLVLESVEDLLGKVGLESKFETKSIGFPWDRGRAWLYNIDYISLWLNGKHGLWHRGYAWYENKLIRVSTEFSVHKERCWLMQVKKTSLECNFLWLCTLCLLKALQKVFQTFLKSFWLGHFSMLSFATCENYFYTAQSHIRAPL